MKLTGEQLRRAAETMARGIHNGALWVTSDHECTLNLKTPADHGAWRAEFSCMSHIVLADGDVVIRALILAALEGETGPTCKHRWVTYGPPSADKQFCGECHLERNIT